MQKEGERVRQKQSRAWGACLLWMGVIFLMSAMPGDVSGAQSSGIVEWMLTCCRSVMGEEITSGLSSEMIHRHVRKGAHMAEYAILFWLYRRALHLSGNKRPGITALCLCGVYAATDEFHQRFVPGRGPSIADVGIDTLGAGIAWGIWVIMAKLRYGRNRPHMKK